MRVTLIDMRDESKHHLRFVGGLFGVVQNLESGALAPEFGWGVVHEPPSQPVDLPPAVGA